jgi:DNA-binding LacI/PurR family transcriptional regulator
MGVTSAEVARAAGVSRTTVSYVLNSTPGTAISEATRRRVLEAADRLGYTPHPTARALRRGTSDLVLVVLPHWPIGPVLDTLLDHLTDDLAERDLAVLVHHGRGRPLADLLRAVRPRTVVGLAAFDRDQLAAMRRAGVPVVGARDDGEHAGSYVVSQRAIGRMQADHLLARGRRRLGWAGTTDERLVGFARPRLDGVAQVCEREGLLAPVVAELDLDPASAAAAARTWLDAGVDAVAAYNDEVALAVLAGLRMLGARVPADVAVIGVDDAPGARTSAPPLTTVSQSIEVQAAFLAAATVAALDGVTPPEPPPDMLAVVGREST